MWIEVAYPVRKKDMIKMDEIKKIVKLVLISGYLKNHKPLSLMVVGNAGTGKTQTISYHKSKRAVFLTDLSYRGVLDLFKKQPEITHLIIPDFLKITMKRRSTSDNLISLLNALTEDGVGHIQMYNFNEDFGGKVAGIIIATTKSSFIQQRKQWDAIGFTSRMIICSYDYKQETISEIFSSINSDEWLKKGDFENLKGLKDKIVTSTKELNQQFNVISNRKFRTLKQLQTLAKCNALLRNSNIVEQQDVDEIKRLSKFMNLDFTKI